MTVDLAAIRAAAELTKGVVHRTPLHSSRLLSERIGIPVWLKCENTQRAGSFKIRGAYVRMHNLTDEEKARGVVAASAGNHAQGVALAAQFLGLKATVFMPQDAALPKIEATRGYGATVKLAGATLDESLVVAKAEAERTGAVLIHPFDHEDIIAGQGTIGLEILEQIPDVATIVVPTGGGGLVAGIATAMAEAAPHVRVVGVQAEAAASYPASYEAGHPVTAKVATMADGIAVPTPGVVPFEILSRLQVPIRTVSENQLSQALLLLAERAKMVVEPSGAAGIASILAEHDDLAGPIVVVLSGGNVDPLLLMRVIRHGLTAAGRYLSVTVVVPDRPGALAGLLAELAAAGSNVVDVFHSRTWAMLGVDEVGISVEVETKGHDHCQQVLEMLQAKGYRLV